MNNYEIIVHWSTEDSAFIAEVPELAGCMADGQTYVEAVKNAEIAIEEWIETAQLLDELFLKLEESWFMCNLYFSRSCMFVVKFSVLIKWMSPD